MANLRDIKEQMIGMNPNNEDWKDWVNRQKRVDNLTNGEGELKTKGELDRLFEIYQKKHNVANIPNTNYFRNYVENLTLKELCNVKQIIEERINYLKDEEMREKANEAKMTLQFLKDKGYDINSILEQFI